MENKNAPAFAQSCTSEGYTANVFEGLTKREYFAGLALQEMLGESTYINKTKYSKIAERAVALADALLAELEKTK